MRLIDADALIEDVRKHSESYFADDFAHYWVNKQPTIEPERKTGRWIPVSERLPEPWDLVLVTDSCKNVSMCQRGLNLSDGWYDECENWMYFSTSVIAWMPLPEPYQGGEQE